MARRPGAAVVLLVSPLVVLLVTLLLALLVAPVPVLLVALLVEGQTAKSSPGELPGTLQELTPLMSAKGQPGGIWPCCFMSRN